MSNIDKPKIRKIRGPKTFKKDLKPVYNPECNVCMERKTRYDKLKKFNETVKVANDIVVIEWT